MWIDRNVSPSAYRIGVADATPSDAERFSALTGDNARITVVARTYPIEQLEEYKEIIYDIVKERENLALSLGTDPVVGKVFVEMTPLDPALGAEIEAAGVPADAYTIALGGGGFLTHTSRWEYPPYEGGLGVHLYPEACPQCVEPARCTTGFTMIANDGIQKGITAGHCDNYNPNDVWMDAPPEHVSSTGLNSLYSQAQPVDSDAVRFYIPPSAKTNRIFVAGSGLHRTMKPSSYLSSELTIGTKLCFQGIKSDNNNCGGVNRRNILWISTPNNIQHEHIFTINFPGIRGDSGGPVYGVRSDGSGKAAGMVAGNVIATDSTLDMAFHVIGYITNDLDLAGLYYG